MSWFVFRTQPRAEKKVAERLDRHGYEVYLPLQKMLRQWSDRKKLISEPLYKSYLFVNTDEEGRRAALEIAGVARCLFQEGRPSKARNEEIEAIKLFLGELNQQPDAKIFGFEVGQELSIKSGALNGLNGKYISRHGDDLFLYVETMGRVIQAKLPLRYVLN